MNVIADNTPTLLFCLFTTISVLYNDLDPLDYKRYLLPLLT